MAQELSPDNGASYEPLGVALPALYAGVMFGPLPQPSSVCSKNSSDWVGAGSRQIFAVSDSAKRSPRVCWSPKPRGRVLKVSRGSRRSREPAQPQSRADK